MLNKTGPWKLIDQTTIQMKRMNNKETYQFNAYGTEAILIKPTHYKSPVRIVMSNNDETPRAL